MGLRAAGNPCAAECIRKGDAVAREGLGHLGIDNSTNVRKEGEKAEQKIFLPSPCLSELSGLEFVILSAPNMCFLSQSTCMLLLLYTPS